MTIERETIPCPCCGNSLERSYIGSYTIINAYTDFSCIGNCSNMPTLTTCHSCDYLFFDASLQFDKNVLKNYLQTQDYKDIFQENHKSKPFLIVYHIYRNLNFSLHEQSMPLLYNYYDTWLDELCILEDFKLLYEHYKLLIDSEELKINNQPSTHHIYKMMGEYNRRVSNFEKAKEIFLSIKEIKTVEFDEDEEEDEEDIKEYLESNVKFCDFQLELISELNNEREIICYKSEYLPKFGRTYVLDEDIDKNLSDFENLRLYVEDIHLCKRYDEFFQGLEKLKNNNIDLYASDENQQTLLHLIVDLFTWIISCDRIYRKILKIFEVLVLEFGFDPTLFYFHNDFFCEKYMQIIRVICNNVTKFNKSRGIRYIKEIQEIYYRYAQQIANQNKIKDLSLEKQHHLLTSQFPYCEKVSNLLKLGFLFDRNYEIEKYTMNTEELRIPHERCEYRVIDYMIEEYNYAWIWKHKYVDHIETTHEMFAFLLKQFLPKLRQNDSLVCEANLC